MKGNLVIIVKKNLFHIIYAVSNIPIGSFTRKYRNIKDIKEPLNSFIIKNNLNVDLIKNILFITDFSELMTYKGKHNFGYIKIGHIQKNDINKKMLLNDVEFKIYDFNIQSLHSIEEKNALANYLAMLKKRGIEKIAINSDFSTLDSSKEKEMINYINKMYPDTFTIKASYLYDVFNFVLRQNMLFLDLMLHDTTDKFIKNIKEIFYDLGIEASIYFMKGNGKLMNLDLAAICPFYTWQSMFSATLIGASIQTNERDAFVWTSHNEQIKMGIVQNNIPKLDDTLSYYEGLQVPNFYPKHTYFKTLPNNIKWDKFIKYNNAFHGSTPIINLFKQKNPNNYFSQKLINLEENLTIIAEGALNSLYELELTRTLASSDSKIIKSEKRKLIKEANEILINNNIILKPINFQFKLTPIKYMPKNSIFLKLFVYGKISN